MMGRNEQNEGNERAACKDWTDWLDKAPLLPYLALSPFPESISRLLYK